MPWSSSAGCNTPGHSKDSSAGHLLPSAHCEPSWVWSEFPLMRLGTVRMVGMWPKCFHVASLCANDASDMTDRNPFTEANRSPASDNPKIDADSKNKDLARNRQHHQNEDLRTNQGVRIADNHNQLKAGERGPTLMEDFIYREKMNHFDNERIPERVVHARGAGAHGYFQPYDAAAKYSKAAVFADEATPVFVRFSTVQGSRGSNDTVRDVRGFATKFYTSEGNWDLVGNDFPVFF